MNRGGVTEEALAGCLMVLTTGVLKLFQSVRGAGSVNGMPYSLIDDREILELRALVRTAENLLAQRKSDGKDTGS